MRGFIINGASNDGLKLSLGDGSTIVGNWFGLDSAGTAAATIKNAGDGLQIGVSNNNTIGGLNSWERNVMSGNTDDGMETKGDNNVIIGN